MPITPDDPRLTAFALGELDDIRTPRGRRADLPRPRGRPPRRRDPGDRPTPLRIPPGRSDTRPRPRTSSGDRELPGIASDRRHSATEEAPPSLGQSIRRRRRPAGTRRDPDRPLDPVPLQAVRADPSRSRTRPRMYSLPRRTHSVRQPVPVGWDRPLAGLPLPRPRWTSPKPPRSLHRPVPMPDEIITYTVNPQDRRPSIRSFQPEATVAPRDNSVGTRDATRAAGGLGSPSSGTNGLESEIAPIRDQPWHERCPRRVRGASDRPCQARPAEERHG